MSTAGPVQPTIKMTILPASQQPHLPHPTQSPFTYPVHCIEESFDERDVLNQKGECIRMINVLFQPGRMEDAGGSIASGSYYFCLAPLFVIACCGGTALRVGVGRSQG